MLVLALDTSSAAVRAALVEVNERAALTPRAEHHVVDARGHGEHLAPMIAACLADAAATPNDLAAVVVGTGPGPFTGLRVGLVTAAVLGATLDIPAYGVCSLDGIAPAQGSVLVASDARRNEIYWARYADGARLAGPAVDRPADVPTDGVSAAAGAGARRYADVLGLPLLDHDYPDPAALVARVAADVAAGAPAGPLVPLYLRRPDAAVPGPPKAVTTKAVTTKDVTP